MKDNSAAAAAAVVEKSEEKQSEEEPAAAESSTDAATTESKEQTSKLADGEEEKEKSEPMEQDIATATATATTTTEAPKTEDGDATTTKEEKKEEEKEEPTTEQTKKDDADVLVVVDGEKKEETEETKEVVEEDDGAASEYEEDGGHIEVEEFFVKYKGLSYLHCEWRTRDELAESDKRIDQKLKRFRVKRQQSLDMYNMGALNDDDLADAGMMMADAESSGELFNSDYTVIDRILDKQCIAESGARYYLIKWKALAYDEASWEIEADLGAHAHKKIERFELTNSYAAYEAHTRYVHRPKADRWRQLGETRAYKNANRLREYQLEGINWLTFCWLNGRNCILADEMGLGKTVQSIAYLNECSVYGVSGPFLVLVPLSTIGNWQREFDTWTNFNVIVYHGSSASRQLIQDYEFYFDPAKLNGDAKPNVVKFDALITTYEVLMSDVQLFCRFKWRSVVIDEAHRLKNKNCKLIEGLRYMDVEHKVLLTGTPLQNNVEELFSLLNFLEPQQFNSSVEFMAEFGDLKTDTQVCKLQAILKPMMLRRLKEDVEKNLAPKEETIVEVELTNTQKKYYRAILERNFQFLTRGSTTSNMPNLMNIMMELRKCCNHPYLINGKQLTCAPRGPIG